MQFRGSQVVYSLTPCVFRPAALRISTIAIEGSRSYEGTMLQLSEITCRVAGRTLLDNASTGARVGFVGRNGTGKTTLFKVITGELQPESGTASIPRNMRMGEVAQEAPGGATSLIDTVLEADTERSALLAEADTATDPMRISDIHERLLDIDAHAAFACRSHPAWSGL
jgi:ATP-binding cassette, subfamily F, member 3